MKRIVMASSSQVPTTPAAPAASKKKSVVEIHGDLFDAPENSVLIHACNCLGSWGPVIAAIFKNKYPHAFKVYMPHCKAVLPHNAGPSRPSPLLGTCLLIPPCPGDSKKHWIACLFTSTAYGRNADAPSKILANTKLAMEDLVRQVAKIIESKEKEIGDLYSCRVNSGALRLEWKQSFRIYEQVLEGNGSAGVVTVVVPAKEALLPA